MSTFQHLLAPKPILAHDVTKIGGVAAACSPDPDIQVSTLLVTLISVCKSLGIGRQFVLRALQEKWDETPALFTARPHFKGLS